jgi:hypothetical protein
MLQAETLTLAEWTSVLKPSIMWQIGNLRALAAVKTMWITLFEGILRAINLPMFAS